MTHSHASHTCKDLLGSLSTYVDGDLEAELCRAIEEHMTGCENCRIVVDTLSKTIYLYHAAENETNPPSGVKERLYHALKMNDLLEAGK